MNAEAIVGLAALAVNAILLAVGYGSMKGSFQATINALAARVTALEGEMSTIADLRAQMARIDERTGAMQSGINSILNSWLLREPPGYTPQPAPAAPRRRS